MRKVALYYDRHLLLETVFVKSVEVRQCEENEKLKGKSIKSFSIKNTGGKTFIKSLIDKVS